MKVKNFLAFFSENALLRSLRRFLLVRLHDESAMFYSAENAHAINLDHVDSGHFVFTWERRCLRVRLLIIGSKTVSMAQTKVCPQCKATVPVRRNTCERYDHNF